MSDETETKRLINYRVAHLDLKWGIDGEYSPFAKNPPLGTLLVRLEPKKERDDSVVLKLHFDWLDRANAAVEKLRLWFHDYAEIEVEYDIATGEIVGLGRVVREPWYPAKAD
jgi:hypothetical protein